MESHSGILITFHVLCLIVTVSMLIYGTIQYVNDESTSIVDSKAFHATEDDIYPTMTVCLELDQKMKNGMSQAIGCLFITKY